MGIYDRDYMRNDYVPANRRGKRPPKRRSRLSFSLVVLALVVLGGGLIFFVSLRRSSEDTGTFDDPEELVMPRVSYPLDLNAASFEELMTVPQIGPATAEQIISNRPFGKLEDLLNIYGIGESKLKVFTQYLTINPPASPVNESGSGDSQNLQ